MLTAEVISNSDFHSKIEDGKLWQHVVVTTCGLKSYIRSTCTWKSTRCTLKKGTLQTSIQKPRQEITENHVRMLVHCTWETMIYLHMGNHEVHACCGSKGIFISDFCSGNFSIMCECTAHGKPLPQIFPFLLIQIRTYRIIHSNII